MSPRFISLFLLSPELGDLFAFVRSSQLEFVIGGGRDPRVLTSFLKGEGCAFVAFYTRQEFGGARRVG